MSPGHAARRRRRAQLPRRCRHDRVSGVARRPSTYRPASSSSTTARVTGRSSGSATVPGVEADRSTPATSGSPPGNDVAIARLLDDGIEFVWVLNNDTVVERPRSGHCSPSPTPIHASVRVGSVLYDLADPSRVLTWGGGALRRWSGRTRDARSAADRVDYLTAASMLLRAAALREVGLLRHPVLLHLGRRRPVHPPGRCWLALGGRRALPRLAPLGRHPRTAGAGPLRAPRRRARGVPAHPLPAPLLTTLPMLGYYAATAVRQRRLELWRGAWRGWRAGWSR